MSPHTAVLRTFQEVATSDSNVGRLQRQGSPLPKRAASTRSKTLPTKALRPENKQISQGEVISLFETLAPDCKHAKLRKQAESCLILKHRSEAIRLAKSMLKRWRAHLHLDDLQSAVDLALCEAAKGFNPKQGSAFTTYLHYFIRGNLIRFISAAANNELLLVDGNLETGTASLPVEDGTALIDTRQPDDALQRKQVRSILENACSKLPEIEKDVVFKVFFEEQSVTKVAEDLGYSRGHISRLKTQGLAKLKRQLSTIHSL